MRAQLYKNIILFSSHHNVFYCRKSKIGTHSALLNYNAGTEGTGTGPVSIGNGTDSAGTESDSGDIDTNIDNNEDT